MNITVKEKWDSLAETWNDTGPPASPSIQDLRIYEDFIRKAVSEAQSPSILMLGCTPSLRTLIKRLQLPIICVDLSEGMLTKSTSMLSAGNDLETLICQDWLNMDLGDSTFSAVIGDKFLDNVSYRKWSILKGRILRYLNPQGFVITRVSPQDPSLLGSSFGTLLKRWANIYDDSSMSIQDVASALWEQSLGASAKVIPGTQSIRVFMKEIESIVRDKKELTSSEITILKAFNDLFENCVQYEWTAYSLGNVVDLFAEELTLEYLARSNDYKAAKRQPILVFRANLT